MTQPVTLLPCMLHDLFRYDASTGQLFYKQARQGRKAETQVGTIASKGYRRIEYKYKTYPAHHIVFAMHNGRWPTDQLDHINGIKDDNRIENLRECNNQQNACNRKTAKSSYKGVSLHKGKYTSRICADGKIINIGSFDDPISAARAYDQMAIKIHGEFACLNNC